jgi:hypothetical protein
MVLAVLSGVVGCAPAGATGTHGPSVGTDTRFHGPYASEFQRAFEKTNSTSVRAVLADGVISSQEFAQARAGVTSCMADSGYAVKYDDRGGFDVTSKKGRYDASYQSAMDPVLRACEKKFDGDITFLYRATVVNPRNEDDRPAIRKCLVGRGLIPKGYSDSGFIHDYDAGTLPYDQFDPQVLQCQDDPLGLWDKRQ